MKQMPKLTTVAVGNTTAAAGKAKILFLDDEERILNALRAIFRFKYEVHIATSGDIALQILKDHDIAVVVSDQRMPNMTGIEFLRIAKDVSPSTVRILLTGFSDLRAIIDSVNEGEVFRFLNKPWGNQEIQGIIDEAVTISRAIQLTPLQSAPVEAAASGPRSVVVVKCRDAQWFAAIRGAASPTVQLLHAEDQQAALVLLQKHPVSVLVSKLDEGNGRDNDDIEFLKLLKRELPGLMTVGMVDNADYEEIISLINQAKVYRYTVLPTQPGRIAFFIDSALQQARLLEANPTLLRQQAVENKPLKDVYERASGLFAKIRSLRGLFGKSS